MHYVIAACINYVEYLRSDDYHEDGLGDYKNDIFENAMELVYGEQIWDEINQLMCREEDE